MTWDYSYHIGKASAYKDVLKTEVRWSVRMLDESWNLETVVIGDGTLKDIKLINQVYGKENIVTYAKDGTVKEVWLAADRSYKEANRLYGDCHLFIEDFYLKDDGFYLAFGS